MKLSSNECRTQGKTAVCLLVTLAWLGLLVGVAQDLKLRFGPFLEAGSLPRSFIVSVFFILAATAMFLLETWRPSLIGPLRRILRRLGWVRWLLVIAVGLAPGIFLLYTKWSEVFSGTFLRLFIYISALLLMSWLAARQTGQPIEWTGLLASAVLLATLFSLQLAFQGVVSYPFSLSWSEGNRLWDYSVRFGRRLYLYPANKPIRAYIDIGRQALWGLPFLLPNVSIVIVRLWSAVVFTLPYALLGWLLFWRTPVEVQSTGGPVATRSQRLGAWFLGGLWAYLFLSQGPIYTPLILAAALVAIAWIIPFIWRRPWLAAILAAAAGYYAKTSRFTWMFAPGIWAAMLSMVETAPIGTERPAPKWSLAYWGRAILLGLAGVIGGYGIPYAQSKIRSLLRGTELSSGSLTLEGLTVTAGRQPLLWDRLWPNPTYAPGIVLGLLMAVIPMILLLVVFAIRRRWHLDLWQKLALFGALLAFLVVGLVVSVKIGGGGNLHNMDMFLVSLLFTAGLAWRAGLGDWLVSLQAPLPRRASGAVWWVNLILLVTLLAPVVPDMLHARPLVLPSAERVEDALKAVQDAVAQARPQGEILFIDQRQLLTFGQVSEVPLVPEYEKKYMMDEAMAAERNEEAQKYFERFYRDLANHRFVLIISEPLWVKWQGDQEIFGNENDAWVKWISVPVLCYYQPVEMYQDVGLQFLVPKPKSPPSAEVTCPEY